MVFIFDCPKSNLTFKENLFNGKNSKITSIFASNGTGKSTICRQLNMSLCDNYIHHPNYEFFTNNFDIKSMGSSWVYSKKFKAIYINNYLENKKGVMLPFNKYNYIDELNFSNYLSYPNINKTCFTNLNQTDEEVILWQQYNLLEKSFSNNSFNYFNIDNEAFKNNIYVYNSTAMQIKSGSLIQNKIHIFSFFIEYLSSLMKISIYDFLILFQNKSHTFFETTVLETIYSHYLDDISNNPNFIIVVNNMLSWFNVIDNKELFLSLLFGLNTIINNRIKTICNEIFDLNNKIEKNFPVAKNIFLKYFSYKFKDISLNKRFSSSLNCYVYDFKIINNLNNTFYSFDFFNNIGSEGEKKLINLLYILIDLISLPDYTDHDSIEYLITADDAFDSFDNANLGNIFNILSEVIKNKSCYFIHFTHDYEIFRNFNNRLSVDREDMFLLNRNKQSRHMRLTKFGIKKDFYSDYFKNLNPKPVEEQIILIIALIPHYRNVMDLLYGQKSEEYLLPTFVLHLDMAHSLNNLKTLLNKSLFENLPYLKNTNKKNKIVNYINNFNSYSKFMWTLFFYFDNDHKITKNLIEYRLFMSICARVIIEDWLFAFLNRHYVNTSNITSNQTSYLINAFDNYINTHKIDFYYPILKIFNNINSYIPDYVHLSYNSMSFLMNVEIDNLIDEIKLFEKEAEKIRTVS